MWVATARGLGSLLPADQRIADDPYGAQFWSPTFARLLESGTLRALGSVGFVRTWIAYMQVRTKLFDDKARAFAERGGRQVVVLGAGFTLTRDAEIGAEAKALLPQDLPKLVARSGSHVAIASKARTQRP